MCSKATESKDGLCIIHVTWIPLQTKNNTKNVTSQFHKPGISSLPKDQEIKVKTSMENRTETILTLKDEGDITNETAVEFASKLVAGTLENSKISSSPVMATIIFSSKTTESPSFSTTKTTISSTVTTEVLPSPTTENTAEDTLLTSTSFSVVEITAKDELSTFPSSPAPEIITKDSLPTFPSSPAPEIVTEDSSSMFPSSSAPEIITEDSSSMSSSSPAPDIVTEDSLMMKTFSSPMSEDSIDDEITNLTFFVTENIVESKATTEFASTITVENGNISETKKENPTTSSSISNISDMSTTTNPSREITFNTGKSSEDYSEIDSTSSLFSSDSSNDSSTTDLQIIAAIPSYLAPQPQCKFNHNI